jgi:hypothetical protein
MRVRAFLRRHWRLATMSSLALLLVASYVSFVATSSKITPENAARITCGMSLDEVERILGGPPTFPNDGLKMLKQLKVGDAWVAGRWCCPEGKGDIVVYADHEGKAIRADFVPDRTYSSPLDKMRRYLASWLPSRT